MSKNEQIILGVAESNQTIAYALDRALGIEDRERNTVQFVCWADGSYVEAEEYARDPEEYAWASDDFTIVNIPIHLIGSDIAESILMAQC